MAPLYLSRNPITFPSLISSFMYTAANGFPSLRSGETVGYTRLMKSRVTLLLVLLAWLPLDAQVRPVQLEVPYRLFTLKNGLTVILHQDKSVPVVAVNLWYHVGS